MQANSSLKTISRTLFAQQRQSEKIFNQVTKMHEQSQSAFSISS